MSQASDEVAEKLREALKQLDGTVRSRVALLSGLTVEEVDALGGVEEEEK